MFFLALGVLLFGDICICVKQGKWQRLDNIRVGLATSFEWF